MAACREKWHQGRGEAGKVQFGLFGGSGEFNRSDISQKNSLISGDAIGVVQTSLGRCPIGVNARLRSRTESNSRVSTPGSIWSRSPTAKAKPTARFFGTDVEIRVLHCFALRLPPIGATPKANLNDAVGVVTKREWIFSSNTHFQFNQFPSVRNPSGLRHFLSRIFSAKCLTDPSNRHYSICCENGAHNRSSHLPCTRSSCLHKGTIYTKSSDDRSRHAIVCLLGESDKRYSGMNRTLRSFGAGSRTLRFDRDLRCSFSSSSTIFDRSGNQEPVSVIVSNGSVFDENPRGKSFENSERSVTAFSPNKPSIVDRSIVRDVLSTRISSGGYSPRERMHNAIKSSSRSIHKQTDCNHFTAR